MKAKHFLNTFTYLLIYTSTLLIYSFLYTSSWPTLRFDYQRTGTKYEVAIPSPTPVGWSIEIQGEIVGSPVVKDDIVYFASRDNSIWALNAYTGEILWQYSTSGRIDCTPVVWNNYVYVLSFDGKLYCFKKFYSLDEDCIPLWTYDTQSKSISSPIIIEDEEIVGEEKNPWIIFVSGSKIGGVPYGKLYIIDSITGSLIKQIDLGSFSYSSISYSDGKIYFTTNDGLLRCYDLKTQQFLWTKMFSSCFNQTSVAIKEDKIYLYAGDIERNLYVLDKTNGEVLWSTGPLTNIATDNNSVAVFEDKILVNIYPTSLWEKNSIKYSSQTILCISTTTKQILWRKDITVDKTPQQSYNLTSAISISNNIAYIGTNNGKFYAINILTGEVLAEYNFSSPIVCSPAISNGWMYFSEVSGKFYGVKLDKFLSIKNPDCDDVVINKTTVTILSSGYNNELFYLEYYDMNSNRWVEITTGSLKDKNEFLWSTDSILDGKYAIRLRLNTTDFAINNIIVDNSPLPPTNITAMLVDKTKVLLTWTKSFDDSSGNNDVVRYNIYRSTNNVDYQLITYVPKGTTFYLDTPSVGATYYYVVSSKDKRSESVFSAPKLVFVPPTNKPQKPENFGLFTYTRYVSSSTIVLKWEQTTEEQTDIKAYNLYRKVGSQVNFVLYATINKTDTTVYYYIDNILNNVSYYYYLTSVNNYDVESDSTDIVFVFISSVTKPLPPRSITAFDTPNDHGGNITLIWLYSLDEESQISKVVGYNIYKSSDGLSFYPTYYFYNVNKTTYTYIDTFCPIGTTFYYYITSVNQHGLESEPTDIVFAYSIADAVYIDTQPPQPPTNLTAIDYPNDDGKKIILIWSLSEDDGSGENDVVKYKIYRSVDGKNFMVYSWVSAGTTYYIDSSVLPNNTYWYYLTAVDKNGNESGGTYPVFVVPFADGVPKKPTGLSINQRILPDKIQIIISWLPTEENSVIGYKIYKSSKTQENFYLLKQISKTTFYIDEDCEPQEVYYYYITAVNVYGYESEHSESKSITTEYKLQVNPGQEITLVFKKDNRKLELIFAKDSLSSAIEIQIKKVQQEVQLENSKSINVVYQILPSGIKFKTPVVIRIYYKDEDVQNVNRNMLRIAWYDDETKTWRLLDSSKFDIQKNCVEAQVYQLGLYAVVEYSATTSEIFKDEYVYAFPSPAKGDKVYFKFLLYQPAKVKVYVYNIAGNLVWKSSELDFKEQDVGKTHVVEWDIKDVATGMYIFRLEGKNERQKKNVIKRFAVIH
jgi:outer membrane protein assembly factor BamB